MVYARSPDHTAKACFDSFPLLIRRMDKIMDIGCRICVETKARLIPVKSKSDVYVNPTHGPRAPFLSPMDIEEHSVGSTPKRPKHNTVTGRTTT